MIVCYNPEVANRVNFVPGEWYHCFSRGVDGRVVFESDSDYRRFIETLYLANSADPVHRSNANKRDSVYARERGNTIVSIGAYALMPNHFHLLIRELDESGISRFMQKVGISYGMYFNIKNERIGNLFVRPFRSRHVSNDIYFQHCVDYIHLNPLDLFEPAWKSRGISDIHKAMSNLLKYPHSSYPDFYGEKRDEKAILGSEIDEAYFIKSPLELLGNAVEYRLGEEVIKMTS